jgi:hypothetical protein
MDETLQSAISFLESSQVPIDGKARVRGDAHIATVPFCSEEDRKRAHEILTKVGIRLGPILTPKTR